MAHVCKCGCYSSALLFDMKIGSKRLCNKMLLFCENWLQTPLRPMCAFIRKMVANAFATSFCLPGRVWPSQAKSGKPSQAWLGKVEQGQAANALNSDALGKLFWAPRILGVGWVFCAVSRETLEKTHPHPQDPCPDS